MAAEFPQRTLTFAEHLEELRRRLGLSLLVLLATSGVSMTQAGRIIAWLRRPVEPFLPSFAYFTLTEPLLAYLKVSVLAGVALAMPYLLWQVWGFVRSGLTLKEHAYGRAFIWWGSGLFLAGVLFAYVVLLPVSVRVLLGIGRDVFEPVLSINAYLSFVTTLSFWCGVIFELPAVVCLLAKVGVVSPEWLRQQRAYAILVMVIVAALVTPTTDPINLLLLAVPLMVLYELSIVMARISFARRAPTPPCR